MSCATYLSCVSKGIIPSPAQGKQAREGRIGEQTRPVPASSIAIITGLTNMLPRPSKRGIYPHPISIRKPRNENPTPHHTAPQTKKPHPRLRPPPAPYRRWELGLKPSGSRCDERRCRLEASEQTDTRYAAASAGRHAHPRRPGRSSLFALVTYAGARRRAHY